MEIKYKIWIDENSELVFGRGRNDILQALNEEHSLNAAAKKLRMSFRGAWGRIKVSQERMGIKLITISDNHRTSQLTQEARAISARFEKLEKDMEKLIREADQDFEKLICNREK